MSISGVNGMGATVYTYKQKYINNQLAQRVKLYKYIWRRLL